MDRRAFLKKAAAIGTFAVGASVLPGCSFGGRKRVSEKGANSGKMAELPLPAPDTTSDFGIDSAVNMSTIDEWLGRDDVVYRDLRMLVDPADFKAVGGDPLLSRAIAGFKVVPFPFLATLPLLPIEGIYQGDALYRTAWDERGNVASAVACYEEADWILEDLFPKDKAIFLMCGAGGYAALARALLVHLGWSEKRLYNIGGAWEYEGDYSIESVVRGGGPRGRDLYAFWRLDYAALDFSLLNRCS